MEKIEWPRQTREAATRDFCCRGFQSWLWYVKFRPRPKAALPMSETPLLPGTNTIALWMPVAITTVIAAQVITGTIRGQKRKEIYKILEKLFGLRQELGNHQIEITKSDLKALAAKHEEGEAPERGDPTLPAHMQTRGEGLFE